MVYKTVIFDLDGLLIDSECISYQLFQDLIKPYGYSFSIDEYMYKTIVEKQQLKMLRR